MTNFYDWLDVNRLWLDIDRVPYIKTYAVEIRGARPRKKGVGNTLDQALADLIKHIKNTTITVWVVGDGKYDSFDIDVPESLCL